MRKCVSEGAGEYQAVGREKFWGAVLRDGAEPSPMGRSEVECSGPDRGSRVALLAAYTLAGLAPGPADIQLRALARHLVHDVFPALRQRNIKRIELHTSCEPGACLTSETPGAPVYFPGTATLNRRLQCRGLASLRLAVDLDTGQIAACVFLAMKAISRRAKTASSPIARWLAPRALANAMAAPKGYTQFSVQVRLVERDSQLRARPAQGRGDSGWPPVMRRRLRSGKTWAAAYLLAPVALLALALLSGYGRHATLAPACGTCAAAIAATAAYALYIGITRACGGICHGRLLHAYWDGVNALNLKVQAQNRALRQTNALKDTLLQVGSHDIRNPLVNIMLLSEAHLARSKRDAADPAKAWRVVHSEAERIRGIVENFMNLERIQQGRLSVDSAPFDLGVVARDVLRAREAELEVRHLAVGITIEPGLNAAHGDPRHVVEVLHNYLGNAMKFSPAGSTIQVRVRMRGNHIRVEVKDCGPGVPAPLRHKLFQEFALIGIQSARGDVGTGLGLSIARKLVEFQGGSVGAEFPANGGSVFWFELPLASAQKSGQLPELVTSSLTTR